LSFSNSLLIILVTPNLTTLAVATGAAR
jgi:hypothetical protein